MTHRSKSAAALASFLCFALSLFTADAFAQAAKSIAGTWTLVSSFTTDAHFGKYSVDDKSKALVLRIESATYPNWNGTEQKRPFTLSGKDLKWTAANASGGGTAELTWKRVD